MTSAREEVHQNIPHFYTPFFLVLIHPFGRRRVSETESSRSIGDLLIDPRASVSSRRDSSILSSGRRHQMEMEDGGIGIGANPGALVEEEYGDSTRSKTRPTRFQIMERELPTSRMHHKTNLFIQTTLSITDLRNTTHLVQLAFQSFHFLSIFEWPEVIISDGQCMLEP